MVTTKCDTSRTVGIISSQHKHEVLALAVEQTSTSSFGCSRSSARLSITWCLDPPIRLLSPHRSAPEINGRDASALEPP